MNFDEAIDDIIFRYKLDVYYPKYKLKKKAEKYLQIWVKKVEKTAKNDYKILCLSSSEEAISNISFFTLNSSKFEYIHIPVIPIIDTTQLMEIVWEQYQQVWIISYEGGSIIEWLHKHKILFYSLYDDFSINGIELEDEFYNIYSKKYYDCSNFKDFTRAAKENVFLEWHYLYMMYENSNDKHWKKYYLKKLFFISITQRNFVLAEKYKNWLCEFEDETEIYNNAWNEIIKLIHDLARAIKERKKEDIIMFWMDQLIYNSEQNMPFVKQEMDNGIYFENAFTLFCNTYPTFRYLFTDVTENTIELFSRKNVMTKKSKVCELLSRYNYDFKVISSEFNHMNIKRAYCSGGCVEPYISISALLWKVFMSLLDSQKACFMVMHELIQTHGPIMTSEMNYEMLQNNNNAPKLRKVKALNDINEQIKFYVSMLNEKATRIYMSDHGTGDEVCQQMRCMFAITGESYVPQRVKEMFSYKNFYLLLKQMLDKKIQLENITCKYAQIYGFPLYNRILIGNRIKRGECFISDFEFRGCVTEDNIYLLIQEDRELLLNRNQLPTMQYILPSKKDICNEEILPDFRDKIGTIYIDWKAEKWKYTMYYKRVYENWKNYNRNQITELNQYIRESGYSMIGIRMGGIHSAVLYECLDDDNQNRIIAFIDNNPNCECVKFKKKIITVYEMLYVEQEMVILSSFEKLEFLRHESSYYPKNIEIFDMYQFLQEKGYPNKAIYCDFKGMPEDGYKVNFPFEE